jgi:hypothetical protein
MITASEPKDGALESVSLALDMLPIFLARWEAFGQYSVAIFSITVFETPCTQLHWAAFDGPTLEADVLGALDTNYDNQNGECGKGIITMQDPPQGSLFALHW